MKTLYYVLYKLMNMERFDSVLIFSLLLFGLVILLILLFRIHENRKRKNIKKKFKTFISEHDLKKNDLRAVPRILIPESIDIILNLPFKSSSHLKAAVLDISLTGISARPRFSLKKLPQGVVLTDVTVHTPVNRFYVAELKLIRKEHRMKSDFMAFRIVRIEADQFEQLQFFMTYLNEFLAHDHKKN
jgi:hypothetical protein